MEHDRLNSPSTSVISVEVLGHQLQFSQDPNSQHLGTTVWDASVVFAKFLEKNCRRGKFSPSKLKGKRAIELGAGCGVAGFGMALLGCDVVATDQIEVVPLLKRNVERNTSTILHVGSDSFGSIQVAELDWGNDTHIRALNPPFDYIIGTDVVYAEHLLEPLLQTIFALSGPKTTIILGYEIRSTNVHEQMLDMWRRNFELKVVPRTKMHSKYQHQSIQLYIMGLKPKTGSIDSMTPGIDQQTVEVDASDDIPNDDNVGSSKSLDKKDDRVNEKVEQDLELLTKVSGKGKELTDWEARRVGSMAARLLRDVKIT